MKIKQIIIAGTLLVSVATFAQKDELKALKKIYAKETPNISDIASYKENLTKLESLATEESDKVSATFYKSFLPIIEIKVLGPNATPIQKQNYVNSKNISSIVSGLNATLEFEKKSGKKIFTDKINETIEVFKPELRDYAVALGENKKYIEASDVLYAIYQLDKKDQEMLYYAANYAVKAQDNAKALQYYKELKELNYSGEGTLYFATDKTSKKEENFGTSNIQRDIYVKTGQFEKPRQENIPSKKGEIYKNIALILIQDGKIEEAKSALSDARKANTDDTSLIIAEANVYFKLNDIAMYKKLVNEALEKNPNDVELLFNLGAVASEAKQYEEAEKYYNKVIALDPNYINAYINLSDIKLKPDTELVEKMNKLGVSAADLKQYDKLKAERQKLFNDVLPIYEKAFELVQKLDLNDKINKDQYDFIKSNLKTVYNLLEMTDKYKALKAKE